MKPDLLLTCALDIGEQMLISGAEIGRVEDTVRHICRAYGCKRTDVFTITSSIVVSIEDEERNFFTQSRRIIGTSTDLTKLDQLNALSRRICHTKPDFNRVQQDVQEIVQAKPYPLWLEALAAALIAGAFAVFFGGCLSDAALSAALGLGLHFAVHLLRRARMNQIFTNVVASFLMCFCAIGLGKLGIGRDVNQIIIGNIMLLIPGIALTNSLRDMISGDIMSGLLRFFDAILVAAAIAAGYILAARSLGGGL